MDSAISGLIIISLLLIAVVTVGFSVLNSQDQVMRGWQTMEQRMNERAHTDITPVSARTIPGTGSDTIEIVLENTGSVKWSQDDFDDWDVILKYTGIDAVTHTQWYQYTTSWVVNSMTNLYEPNILNPGEQVVLWVIVSPTVATGTTNVATVSTPNGIVASTVFTR